MLLRTIDLQIKVFTSPLRRLIPESVSEGSLLNVALYIATHLPPIHISQFSSLSLLAGSWLTAFRRLAAWRLVQKQQVLICFGEPLLSKP
jgi:hypothetical protein